LKPAADIADDNNIRQAFERHRAGNLIKKSGSEIRL